jgi:hypothetical protein
MRPLPWPLAPPRGRARPEHASVIRCAVRHDGLLHALTLTMLTKQMLHLPSGSERASDGDVVPGGMFLASVAIGMAPAIAAAGLLLGAGLIAVAGSGCLLGVGLITAVVTADR